MIAISDGRLVGRDLEFDLLDNAWADPNTTVLSIVAGGGVGKSTLVDAWLGRLVGAGYPDAERVFAWHFQGAPEQNREITAEFFIDAALRFFGDPLPGLGSPWEKGERLARWIRQSRTLLVLDGLELLQYTAGSREGCLKDPGLQVLLRDLASSQPGLCVLATARPVVDLDAYSYSTAPVLLLENLPDEAGMLLLEQVGVRGSDGELRQAVRETRGHPLTLRLLGRYLSKVLGGEVGRRFELAWENDQTSESRIQGLLAGFENWLGPGPERTILNLLGLFERPVHRDTLAVLRAAPAIDGLTEDLFRPRRAAGLRGLLGRRTMIPLDDGSWDRAVETLRDCGLLITADPTVHLDMHPLIRAHFAARIREHAPDAWREAHARLYQHLKNAAPPLAESLEPMRPLFDAIVHGCLAGRRQDAFESVYWRRVNQGDEFFSTRKLGAFGTDLAMLSTFFERRWDQLYADLRDDAKTLILAGAGLRLRALGRLPEAMTAIEAGRDLSIARQAWKHAAIQAGNLGELALVSGELSAAVRYAEEAVGLADRSGDAFQRMGKRARFADALHQTGRLAEAEAVFRQAEALQKQRQPQFPLLYSVQGFLYCDLLLSQGEARAAETVDDSGSAGHGAVVLPIGRELALGRFREVQKRVAQTLRWVTQAGRLLDISLDLLTLGRALALEAKVSGSRDFTRASAHLDKAVDGLRQAGSQDHLLSGLLVRGLLRCERGEPDAAQADLWEAWELARRHRMRLYEADIVLGFVRLHGARGATSQARTSLEKAKTMVAEMGYHRWDWRIAELERCFFRI